MPKTPSWVWTPPDCFQGPYRFEPAVDHLLSDHEDRLQAESPVALLHENILQRRAKQVHRHNVELTCKKQAKSPSPFPDDVETLIVDNQSVDNPLTETLRKEINHKKTVHGKKEFKHKRGCTGGCPIFCK